MPIIDPGVTVFDELGRPTLSPNAINLPQQAQNNLPTPTPQQQSNLPTPQQNAPQQVPQQQQSIQQPHERYAQQEQAMPQRNDPQFQQHGLAKIGNVIASLGVGPFAPLVYNALKQVPYRQAMNQWENKLGAIKPEVAFEEEQNRQTAENKRSEASLASTNANRKSMEADRIQREKEAAQRTKDNEAREKAREAEVANKEKLDKDKADVDRLHKEKQDAKERAEVPQTKAINLYAKRASGQVLSNEENAFLKGYEKNNDLTKVQPGVTRMEVLGETRGQPMIDTKNQNAPIELNWNQINAFNKSDPGRFLPAGTAIPAMQKEVNIEDVRGSISQVMEAMKPLPENLSFMAKAELAAAMRENDPKGVIGQLVSSGALGQLKPEEQNYVAAVANLAEVAMSIRSQLGGGQGQDVRNRILAAIPGAANTSKTYSTTQLNYLGKTLDRLLRGIPKVPLRSPENSPESSAPTTLERKVKIIKREPAN
jgi:hypothetical protein